MAAWHRVMTRSRTRDPRTKEGTDQIPWGRLRALRRELLRGSYRPAPLRARLVPKTGAGPHARRRITVPAIRDRIVQAAAHLVLAPILDADFLPCSHAFRARRGVATAIKAAVRAVEGGACHVVRADIRSCFDTLPRRGVLRAVQRRVADPRLLSLLRAWLRGPLLDGCARRWLASGIPQGLPISPLLCNAYLHRLDEMWVHESCVTYVRYADDVLLACRERPGLALGRLERTLRGLGLRLNAAKTRVSPATEGFDFVGVHVRLVSEQGAPHLRCALGPSHSAIAHARERLRMAADEIHTEAAGGLVASLNACIDDLLRRHPTADWLEEARSLDECLVHVFMAAARHMRGDGFVHVIDLPASALPRFGVHLPGDRLADRAFEANRIRRARRPPPSGRTPLFR